MAVIVVSAHGGRGRRRHVFDDRMAVTYRPNLTDRSATTPLPAEALRNLLAVLKTLDIAKFTVYTTGVRAYSAKLSLRFARPG